MTLSWRYVLLVLLLYSKCRLSKQELCPVLKAVGVAENDKTGCYVVVLKKETNSSTFESMQSRLLELSKDAHLYGSVETVLKALTVTLNDSSLELVSLHCAVLVSCYCVSTGSILS